MTLAALRSHVGVGPVPVLHWAFEPGAAWMLGSRGAAQHRAQLPLRATVPPEQDVLLHVRR